MLQFTHLLMEAKSKYSPNIKPYLKTHDILDSVDGFSHIALNYNILPPIKIKTRPIIFIMKRKPNIQYDPKKAILHTYLKQSNESIIEKSIERRHIVNNTVKHMEPILDEIMESLEQFEKPLNINDVNVFDTEVQNTVKLENITYDSTEFIESLSIEEIPNTLSENNLSHLETSTIEEKLEIIPKLEDSIMTERNLKLQTNVDNDFNISEQKLELKKEENEKSEVINERLKFGNAQQDTSTLKEVVKKIIQEKMEAVKQRKDTIDEKILTETPQKINAKMKRIIPIKTESPQKIKIITKQELKEKSVLVQELKEKPMVIQEVIEKPAIIQEMKEKTTEIQGTTNEYKPINVKESIRNIINQFKEFEKDFVHEDLEINKREIHVNNGQSIEINTKPTDDSSSVDVVTEVIGTKIIKDAKESLKDIINQFKQIKSELTSEEDDQFEKIEATYMERPIAETLMQFSEALKNLIQRRKKNKVSVINTFENKRDIPKLQTTTKMTAEDLQFPTESSKNSKMQNYDDDKKLYSIEKVEKVIQNVNPKDSSSPGTNKVLQEKHLITHTNIKNIPLNAQKSTNSVSNNIGNNYAFNEKNETARKNVGNSSND